MIKEDFFYELNYVEDGEYIDGKETIEDQLVMDVRSSWKHRYNLERRQQYLRSPVERLRLKKEQKEGHRKRIRDLRRYRSNREFAPDLHQSLESWRLQNGRKHLNVAFIVKYLLTFSWAEDPSRFHDAKAWGSKLYDEYCDR